MVRDHRISFVAFWYDGLRTDADIERVLTELSSLGYTGVDWKNTCFDPDKDIAPQLKNAVRIADDMGIATCSAVILGNMIDENRKAHAEKVKRYIAACAEAGIPNVNTAPGNADDTPENWNKLAETLDTITRACDEYGVDLALESVVGHLVHDYPTTKKMFATFDHPRLRLTMDPSHYHMYKSDIPTAIRELGIQKIAHVHVKDAIGNAVNGKLPDEWIFPLLGEGNIEWNPFFKALDDIGYEGYMSIEYEAWRYMDKILHGKVREAARLSMSSMLELINEYKHCKEF